jgi:hypothetical protein
VKLIRPIVPLALALLVLPSCGGSHAKKSESNPISATSDLVIVATGNWRQLRIGSYYYWRTLFRPHHSYTAAVESFGASSSSRRDGNLCHVRWSKLGLEIDFVNVMGRCSAKLLRKSGLWYGASVTFQRWKTDRGLRVGDSLQRLRSLYPKARHVGGSKSAPRWVLAHWRDHEFDFELLDADVRGGRVAAIVTPADYIY